MNTFAKRVAVFPIFFLFFILLTASLSSAFEGTIGTQFTISGSGFGVKKPAVLYEQSPGVVKPSGVKIISYNDTAITCIWKKKLPAGTYNLFVKPTIKGATPFPVGAFEGSLGVRSCNSTFISRHIIATYQRTSVSQH